MATAVKKGAKINFYKFVAIEKPRSSGPSSATKKDTELTNAINKNIIGLNNIGSVLNSILKLFSGFQETQSVLLGNIQKTSIAPFVAKYNTPSGAQKEDSLIEGKVAETQMPGFLEALFNIVKDFLTLAIAKPALAWLSKEENREKIKKVVEGIIGLFKAVSGFVTDRVTGLIDNLYELFRDDKQWWEKIGDFFGAVVNFAGLFVAIRWLSNPLNIIKDFKSVMGGFVNALKGSKKSLLKKAGALGLLAAGGYAIYQHLSSNSGGDDSGGNSDDYSNVDEMYDVQLNSKGGPLKKRSAGGFINGPQSGYPVSLDGGRSVSFIGHGLEYVAQKSNGGFVVPLDTPSTKTNPGLTSSRISEASRMGYDLSDLLQGFASGGPVKPSNNTNTEKSTNRGTDKTVEGGGQSAVVALGRALLRKGFTVAEHPNFRKNSYSGSGANTGKGFNPRGGERVGGHSSGSAHYKGLAIDVTDWRPGDWKGRTKALAQKIFENRNKFKVSQIIHDPWGSWFAGESSKGGSYGGHPTHLHLAFKNSKVKGSTGSNTPSGGGGGGGAGGWKPLLDLIRKKEAGNNYEAMYPSTKLPGATKMTIQQVHDNPKRKGAVGGYQFLNPLGQAKAAGLKPTDKFSPENQDKMAIALITKKRQVTLEMVKKNPDEAMVRLGMEWAALPMPKKMRGHKRTVEAGQSYYAGDGRNKSHITVAEMKKVLGLVGGGGGSIASNTDSDIDDLTIGEGGDIEGVDGESIPEEPKYDLDYLTTQIQSIFSDPSVSALSPAKQSSPNISASPSQTSSTLTQTTQQVMTAKQGQRQQVMQSIQQTQQLATAANAQVNIVAQQSMSQQAAAEKMANSQKPAVVTTGGSSGKPSLISQLNSNNNLMRKY